MTLLFNFLLSYPIKPAAFSSAGMLAVASAYRIPSVPRKNMDEKNHQQEGPEKESSVAFDGFQIIPN
jgi:hypothetical protein